MEKSDIIALIVTSVIGLIVFVLSVILLTGKGSVLIAGFNTMPKSEKAKYDRRKISKFMGKVLLPVGFLFPLIAVGGIFDWKWVPFVFIGIVVALIVFALIYCNTGNRFKK